MSSDDRSKANGSGRGLSYTIEYPPLYTANTTFEQLSSESVSKGHTWWANVVNYIPNITAAVRSKRGLESLRGERDDSLVWWQDIMTALFSVGYGVKVILELWREKASTTCPCTIPL